MNKVGLAEVIFNKGLTGTKKGAEEVLDLIFDTIAHTMKSGDEVSIAGFGTFLARHQKARTARNPKTGEAVHVPPTTKPKFRAGKALKEAVK